MVPMDPKPVKSMRLNVFDRTLGREIDGLLQKGYESQRRESRFVTKTSFAPSSLGWGNGKCPRYWQYLFNGVYSVSEESSQSVATMENGSAAHERLQKALKDSGADIKTEFELRSEDPPIHGFVDVILNDFGSFGQVPLEIKTTRVESFQHKQATGQPADYHLVQLLIYMKLLNTKYGAVVYENRNDQSVLTLPVRMTEENQAFVDGVFEWMRKTYEAFELGQQVARPVTRKNARLCKDCPVKQMCWSQDGGGLALPTLM